VSTLDIRALLAELTEAGVEFILIGGVAVAAHGYVRATEDVDIVPDPLPGNLERVATTLVRMDARLLLAPNVPLGERERRALLNGRSLSVETRHGPLDVVQLVPGVPQYDELAADSVEANLLGVPVRVCSLARLREMKRARGQTQDLADLEHLPEAG
jgi:hypothetical protein